MREPVPEELAHLASWERDALVLWRNAARVLGGSIRTRVTIDDEVTVHGWPPTRLRPDRVLLRGEPGMTLQILFQALRTIGVAYAEPLQGELTVHAIRWLAVQASQRLQVPLVDEVSDAGWVRWGSDADYRSGLRFERAQRVNERRNKHLFDAIAPTQADIPMQHDGLRYGPILLTPRWLSDDWYEIPIESVRGAYAEIRGNTLTLQVLSEQGLATVGVRRYTPSSFAAYRWLAERVTQAALHAQQLDRGTTDDVPEALGALRSPEVDGSR